MVPANILLILVRWLDMKTRLKKTPSKKFQIFIAGTEKKKNWNLLSQEDVKNVLMSRIYIKKNKVKIEEFLSNFKKKPLMMLDPGAYTTHTQGIEINPVDYGNYALENEEFFDLCLNCDKIGNLETTLKNQILLEKMGLDVIPLFHYVEKKINNKNYWKILKDYADSYGIIALGGSASVRSNVSIEWFKKCFSLASERNSLVHGCGMFSAEVLNMFPWWSCDSSNWLSFRGEVFIPQYNKLKRVNWREQGRLFLLSDFIEDLGFDPSMLYDRRNRMRLNIRAFKWYESVKNNGSSW